MKLRCAEWPKKHVNYQLFQVQRCLLVPYKLRKPRKKGVEHIMDRGPSKLVTSTHLSVQKPSVQFRLASWFGSKGVSEP